MLSYASDLCWIHRLDCARVMAWAGILVWDCAGLQGFSGLPSWSGLLRWVGVLGWARFLRWVVFLTNAGLLGWADLAFLAAFLHWARQDFWVALGLFLCWAGLSGCSRLLVSPRFLRLVWASVFVWAFGLG